MIAGCLPRQGRGWLLVNGWQLATGNWQLYFRLPCLLNKLPRHPSRLFHQVVLLILARFSELTSHQF